LLALDIDGTLITNDRRLTLETCRAIQAAQRRGVLVTLSTGRNFYSARNYAQKLDIELPLITANGAMIRRPNGEIIQESLLDRDSVAQLIAEMDQAGLLVEAYHRDGVHLTGSLYELTKIMCGEKLCPRQLFYIWREYRLTNLKRTTRLAQQVAQGELAAHKLFSSGEEEKLYRFQARARQLGQVVEYYPGGFKNRMYLEVMAPGVSKGMALKQLAHHLGVPMSQVVAVGDNLNDTEMIKAAGLGVAMGNGHKELRAMADHVTCTNEEDGVAAVIRDFFLTGEEAQNVI